ncbi:MAG TPA: primosome assembly protein PriA, partial [Sporichthya sp.]|nr:primosome assembly protein PriA [Sporichthya sp.]
MNSAGVADGGAGPPGAVAEQLELVRGKARASTRATRKKDREPPPVAEALPVARVAVDVPLPHLDRPFDYLVPASLDTDAVPGARVRIRFAGPAVDGYLLERVEVSEHSGALARLLKVVSPEPVLSPEVLGLARAVAARYAGTLADVLRLAVPPRHARTEAEPRRPRPHVDPRVDTAAWSGYAAGEKFLTALTERRGPRAVWSATPGADWTAPVAAAMAATLVAGQGALAVVPDGKDLHRLGATLDGVLGPDAYVALTADLGPAERYRRWLAVRRGEVRAVIGTRAATFAPVTDLGLVVVWDDGDDLHAEPRAPYPHTREVLLTRAARQHAAVLVGGFARTVEAEYLLTTGWAREIAPP